MHLQWSPTICHILCCKVMDNLQISRLIKVELNNKIELNIIIFWKIGEYIARRMDPILL